MSVAAAVKSRLNLSKEKYQALRRILKGYFDFNTNQFVRRYLQGTDLYFPILFPTYEQLVVYLKKLTVLETISTIDGKRISFKKTLIQLLENEELYKHLEFGENNLLQIKCGGDGFKLTRWIGEVNFYFTILNLRELIHSPDFVWLIATYSASENYDTFCNNFKELVNEIEDIATNGINITLK